MSSLPLDPESEDLSLILRTPDAVVAAIPYLLGFQPAESLVIVWVDAGRVALSQRIDLPKEHLSQESIKIFTQSIVRGASLTKAQSGVICIFSERGKGIEIPYGDLVTALMVQMVGAGAEVSDALLVAQEPEHGGKRWWSYLCVNDCCVTEGRVLDERVALRIRAQFALLGVAPLNDRRALTNAVQADVKATARMGVLIRRLSADEIEIQHLGMGIPHAVGQQEASIQFVLGVLKAARTSYQLVDSDCARLLLALSEVRVRDTFLWHLSRETDRHGILAVLTNALRKAPREMVAPIATVTAICAWLLGDGARSLIALDRVKEAGYSYHLAELVRLALMCGMPPKTWLAAMSEMTEAECRLGRVDLPLSSG